MVSTRSTWIPGVCLIFAPREFSTFRSIVKMCWQTKKRSIVRPKSCGFPPQPIRITRAGPGLRRPIKSWTNKSLQSDGALWSPLGKLFQISFHKSGQEGGGRREVKRRKLAGEKQIIVGWNSWLRCRIFNEEEINLWHFDANLCHMSSYICLSYFTPIYPLIQISA